MFAGRYAGINFYADFRVWGEMELGLSEMEEVFDLWGSQVGGSAAAPMELNDWAIFGHIAAYVFDFAFQDVEIGRGDGFVFLDDYVASAKEAEAFAEGNVHVKRDGGFGGVGFGVNFFEIVRAEGVVPDRGGGITCVARARTVVAGEEGFAYAKLFARLP
jgi:hypothetical protein